MERVSLFLLCLLAAKSAYGAPTTEAPDKICQNIASIDHTGLLEKGCWGYKECVNGVYFEHFCPTGEVLDQDTRTCHPIGHSSTKDCDPIDCTSLPDGMYADVIGGCKSYNRCYGAVNIAAFLCAANLVFHEEIQACDYKSNVPPPCGTKLPDITTVSS
ncbi:hypothetical protein BsWGS_07748 [Bradybaena similaris]